MTYMARSLACWLVASALATMLAGLIIGPPGASADIGVHSVDRTAGVAGDQVDLLAYCGGCLPRRIRLPILLLPAGDSPDRDPCRGTSCATRAPVPPTSAPYVPLGTAVPLNGGAPLASRLGIEIPDSVIRHGRAAVRMSVASINRLRFRIPDVEPGLYTYVIFCCGLSPPAGGDLIGHPQRRGDRNESRLAHALRDGQYLRVHAASGRAAEPAGTPWVLWGAIAASGMLAVLFARRPR